MICIVCPIHENSSNELNEEQEKKTHLIDFRMPLHHHRRRIHLDLFLNLQILLPQEQQLPFPSLRRRSSTRDDILIIRTEDRIRGRVERQDVRPRRQRFLERA